MKIKNSYCYSLILFILIGFSGCGFKSLFSNPQKALTKAEAKVGVTKDKIEDNKDSLVEKGTEYVYGTKFALQLAPTNSAVNLAMSLNDSAIETLPPLALERILFLEKTVSNLLNTNELIKASGQKQLDSINNQVIRLQSYNTKLESTLEVAEAKFVKVSQDNTSLAQTFSNLKKIFYWTIYIIVGFFVVRIVTMFLPFPYSELSVLVSLPVSFIVKVLHGIVPEAKKVGNLVGSEYKTLSGSLLTSIQNIKDENPSLHNSISATVNNTVDSTLSPVLNQVKADLKMVS